MAVSWIWAFYEPESIVDIILLIFELRDGHKTVIYSRCISILCIRGMFYEALLSGDALMCAESDLIGRAHRRGHMTNPTRDASRCM